MKNGLWAWASEKITLRTWSHIRFDWVTLPVWKKHWQSRMWKIVWNSFVHIFIRLFGCMVIIHHILSFWNHTGAKIIPSELKMPKRGTLLTDFEMGKITGLQEDGKSFTEIADALGRSYNCIGNFLKQKRPYTHGGGHQEKLNERTKRKILEHYLWEIHHLSGNLSHNWNSKSPKKL